MYEGFENRCPFELGSEELGESIKSLPLINSTPYIPGGRLYMHMLSNVLKPVDFTSWRDETLSWHLTCSVSANLNPSPAIVIKGPDAAKFLRDVTINNIDKFKIGRSKHCLICTEDGNIAAQGVLMRLGEDGFEACWLSPYLDFLFNQSDYDASIEELTMKQVIFQTQGPRSLEMLEHAAREDLHDIGFCQFRDSSIAGHPVRILRFGMYGCLGYEVHCSTADAHEVYRTIIEAGKPYGVRRLGTQAYMMDHTPGGSQQLGFHFLPSIDPEFAVAMASMDVDTTDQVELGLNISFVLTGSLGNDYNKRLVNPFELGLGNIIDWDKGDFPGREALAAYRDSNRKRTLTTLVWNYEDLGDIYMSQYRDEEPYAPMDWPGKEWSAENGGMGIEMDKVLDQAGNEVGFSAGRTTDYWHRAMVSLGVVDEVALAHPEGLVVLWGGEGTRQKKVRVTLAPVPFNTHLANRTFDVETIPHFEG